MNNEEKVARIIIDMPILEHRLLKAFCVMNGFTLKEIGLEALREKLHDLKQKTKEEYV